MSNGYIVVIGSLNLDRTFRVDALPRPGATQTVLDYTEGVGGKGANQAAAAATLGARTYMLGCLGQDAAGDTIAAALAAAGVDTAPLVRSPGAPTGTAAILLTSKGENSILVVPGANHALTPQHLRQQQDLLAGAAMLLLQMETPLAVLAEALTIAKPAGVPVMLDPAPAAPLPADLLGQLGWFTPNESEARFYLEQAAGDPARAKAPERSAGQASRLLAADPVSEPLQQERSEAICRYFQSLGPHNVLLKLGAQGAALLAGTAELLRVPALQLAVVDTTGAGDTLNGALAAELARGSLPEPALRFAVAAASLSTTRPGALASLPTRAEVKTLLRDL